MLAPVRTLFVGLVTTLALLGVFVFMPGTVPPSLRDALGVGPARLERAPAITGDGSYAFLQHQRGDPDTPVTYSPCEPIRVEVNPEGVDDEERAREIVLDALGRVSEATGLRLEYAGDTDARPRWRSRNRPALGGSRPVLISFATSDEVSELEGKVAGLGGSASVRRNGTRTYVSGQVTLDADTFDDLLDRRSGARVARAITLHELGHLVGLAHVDDENELMNAESGNRLDFGPGDLRGLAELGRGSCA